MKALTLTPEWAFAIAHLDKRVENRTWKPPAAMIGETIALHAGMKRPDWPAVELVARIAGWEIYGYGRDFKRGDHIVNRPTVLTRGAIVATFTLAGVRAVYEEDATGWEVGPFCWDIADVRVLDRPVTCAGMLGLWTVPGGML
jgi:hypothetical protein